MAEIRDLAQIAAKWVRNSGAAQQSYTEGVQNPRRSWQRSATAANESWKQAVTAAAAANRFATGVAASSDAHQMNMAVTKGAPRFGPGVAAAEGRYSERFAPYAQVIRGLTLPPRGPRGAAANLQRVAVIANALHARRTSTGGAGGQR